MMFSAIVIAALAGFVSASPNSYSIGCMTTLMNIGNNPEVAACLAPSSLLPVLIGAGNGPESVVSPVDTWLASMCASPACSSDTLTAVINNVTTGCSVEFGLPQAQQSLDYVLKNYRTIRKVVCLKDGQTNCATQTLKNIETLTGTMSLNDDDVVALATAGREGFPSNVTCTNCMKGAFTIFNQELPGFISKANAKYATDTCGADFADGGIPPGLISSAWEPSDPAPTPTPSATTTSIRPTATPPVAAAPTPSKKKSSAVGRPSSALTSGSFRGIAISGLIVIWTGMAFA
ncbi:hypothetical protein Hypma_006878 [Hypsizygus marmoreus]|uniref:DUF7729 domain-containing protein n=1 Tax=Hypsizygus marmoreus TaxID=39966 RepID=A0A369JYJ4_HYPMA|nr:hypothetical protein Hypma_006878 [Hypsizygus marmoreus]